MRAIFAIGVLTPVAFVTPADATCSSFITFSNGSTADASQVNSNFTNITNCFAPLASPLFTGNVGIGATGPDALDVYSTGNTTVQIFGTSSPSSVRGGMSVNTPSSGAINFGSYTAVPVTFMISNGEVARFATNGYFGIGLTSPSYPLQVAGGPVAGAGAYVNTSDARLKKDIVPLTYGINAVMQLKPVGFNWLDQTSDWQKQHRLGLLAQDVQSIIPEVVSKANDDQGTLGLAYGELVPVLVKAIQDQQAEINQLKAELTAVKIAK